MKTRKCHCKQILHLERIYVHLMGCPEHSYTQEYEQYSWWKKLWHKSPESIYANHFNS